MAFVSDTELVKSLKAGEYSSVYYFYGKDIMTIEAYTKRFSEKLVSKEDSAYNLHKFDGKGIDLSTLADTIDVLPMFAERICILINDLNAEDLSSDDVAYLIELVKSVSDTTTLIFYNTGIDVTGGKKTATAKNKKLIDAVSKKGTVCEFAYKTARELSKSIISSVAKQGCEITKENAEYLASRCLSNTMLISGEISKLTSYTSSGEITRETIDLLVSRQLDSNAFDLSKAVVRFDGKTALTILDELFFQRAEPVAVLSAISMSFVDLYRAKLASERGIQASQVADDFGYKANRRFVIDNAFRDVRRISTEHMRFCMKVIADTDIALKSTKTDGRLLIEQAIVEMVSKR